MMILEDAVFFGFLMRVHFAFRSHWLDCVLKERSLLFLCLATFLFLMQWFDLTMTWPNKQAFLSSSIIVQSGILGLSECQCQV